MLNWLLVLLTVFPAPSVAEALYPHDLRVSFDGTVYGLKIGQNLFDFKSNESQIKFKIANCNAKLLARFTRRLTTQLKSKEQGLLSLPFTKQNSKYGVSVNQAGESPRTVARNSGLGKYLRTIASEIKVMNWRQRRQCQKSH